MVYYLEQIKDAFTALAVDHKLFQSKPARIFHPTLGFFTGTVFEHTLLPTLFVVYMLVVTHDKHSVFRRYVMLGSYYSYTEFEVPITFFQAQQEILSLEAKLKQPVFFDLPRDQKLEVTLNA